ncbi:MAG: WD40 repeat domain-containing protein [Phycisphaerales bacterium]
MRPGYNQSAFGLADGSVRLWEYDSGREIDTFCAHTLPVEGVAFCEDGSKMVSVSRDGLMCLWDASTGRLLSGVHAAVHPELNPRASLLVSLSPDGRLMAVPNMVAHELRFHRTADGVLAYTVDLASLNIIDSFPSIRISYSPLGTYCFVHDEYGYTNSMTKSLCIRIADGQPRTFTGRFACASPDETRLIAFGLDGSMRLLDIETLTEVFRIGPFGSYYPQARFTGYGDAISVLTENRAITLDGRSWPIRHSENVKINKSPPH